MSIVKNRAPAPIQITAEQILREAKERGIEDKPKPVKQFITDTEELKLYQQNKRKDFEDQLRRQRNLIGVWCKYGLWEAMQKEFERARSVFERALDVEYRNQTLWLKYAEMEMKNQFIAHARNVWDRAVTLLPRIDTFWFKYTYMEELVGAIENTRQLFERWMKWEPTDHCWYSYIKFEERQNNFINARNIYERYIKCHPTTRAYLKYAKWEERNHEITLARLIYERAINGEVNPHEDNTLLLYSSFALFEERVKEFERARVIYQYILANAIDISKISIQSSIPSNAILVSSANFESDMETLKQEYVNFEKKHGTRLTIEDAILSRRRSYYESQVSDDNAEEYGGGYNYDAWFDYIQLEEAEVNNENTNDSIHQRIERVHMIYNRAISYQPPLLEKKYWKRYIYLWINYVIFEELVVQDYIKTRELYHQILFKILPNHLFTFSKLWIMASKFEIRQKNLINARQLLGYGLGLCPYKESLYKGYIEIEMQLGEMERCRLIYMKYIENLSSNCQAWKNYALLELKLGEVERVRGIYELGIQQVELDMPEVLWKGYIDFEISQDEYIKARNLYERLLQKTQHVKVWISYGIFEANIPSNDSSSLLNSRLVFQRGYDELKTQGLKEERILLLDTWRSIETQALETYPNEANVSFIDEKYPRKIKMKRVIDESNPNSEFEEYYDYQFPDDEKKVVGLKLLENAMKWKSKLSTFSVDKTDNPSEIVDDGSGDLSGILETKKRKYDDDKSDDIEDFYLKNKMKKSDTNEIDIDI